MPSSLWLTSQESDLAGYHRAVLNGRGDCPSMVRAVTSTTAGPTAGVQLTDEAGGTALAWVTEPLKAITLTAAAWTAHLWLKESDAAANVAPRVVVTRYSDGATVLDDMGAVTELGTSTADISAVTETATSTALSEGDRLVIRVYADDASSSMATGYSVTFSYGGQHSRAEGDSYLISPVADTLALAGELPAATETIIRRVLRQEQASAIEAAPVVNQDEVRTAFASAIKEYSRLRPRLMAATYSGDGASYDFPLPSRWVLGFSSIESVEYPAGEQMPILLDRDEYDAPHETTLGRQPVRMLRFPVLIPDSGTDNIVLRYTTRHEHTDETDSIPPQDLEAVCWLAAAWLAESLSGEAAGASDSTINADAVNYRDGRQRWAAVASRLRERFTAHLGLDRQAPAAGGIVNWDTYPSWGSGRGDWLTHRNRRR